jgi:REP element-mobilizing transposase RayT
MNYPLGYHITWGTYGTRLHGSAKPHVDRDHNEYKAPLAPRDADREEASRDRMNSAPVRLTIAQRLVVEQSIEDVAARYGWHIRALAPQSDHVHVVITAPREGEALRDALKAAASRWLNKRYPKRRWWAERGSAKYLYEPEYFQNAVSYVKKQRDF